jgi:hypothetical protein
MVLGLQDHAADLLASLLTKVLAELKDDRWMKVRSEYAGSEMTMGLAKAANVATWLHTGKFNPLLAASALQWHLKMQSFWGGRLTGPNLLGVMLSSIESGTPNEAIRLYEDNETKLLAIPPKDFRFCRNARSVLYLFLKSGQEEGRKAIREEALRKFLAAATRWEKGVQPIPYVNKLDVARLVHAARSLEGQSLSVSETLAQVR